MFISNEKTLRQVKQEFQEKFLWLKLEFYARGHEPGEGSFERDHLDDTLTVGDARSITAEGEMSIHGNLKVSSLEQEFQDRYGLNVQVFRRSGEVWLQTTSTDEWTLAEQNEKGAEASGQAGQAVVVDTYEVD
jgi:hypothetical protein